LEEARHRLEFIIKPHRNIWEKLKEAEKILAEAAAREANAKAAEEAALARESAAKAAEEAAKSAMEAAKSTEETAARAKAAKSTKKQPLPPEPRGANTDTGKTQKPDKEAADENIAPDPIPGGIIRFGSYDWRVLTVDTIPGKAKGKRVLLLSEEILESRAYDTDWGWYSAIFGYKTLTWENSTLRQYLNEDFYEGFSRREQPRILLTLLENIDNPERSSYYGSTAGNNTKDKIFLLSINEVMEYLEASKQKRKGKRGKAGKTDDAWWFLRSPGHYNYYVAGVKDYDSQIDLEGRDGGDPAGIRPALWLKL